MSRTRRSLRVKFALLTAAIFVLFSASVACSGTSSSDTFAPITGVTVRAETLTLGRGCGRGATQIFKYVAVVLGRNPLGNPVYDVVLAANLYDCFSDGTFIDLKPSGPDGGGFDYVIQVYAYNEAAYLEAGGEPSVRAAIRAAETNSASLRDTKPTLTTTCTAEQLALVQVFALCAPLSVVSTSEPASVTVSTMTFVGAEGGTVRCDDDFVFVRSRASTGGVIGETLESRCSKLDMTVDGGSTGLVEAPVVISPAAAPASYEVDIALLRADRSVLGETTCTADTTPGRTSRAVCKPIH